MPYSAIKSSANPTEAYSTLNPDTSSDSPSEKSKGVRLVSATQEISHKTSNGRYRHQENIILFIREILVKLKAFTEIAKVKIIKAKLIS